jgi:hypothetical protein
MLKDAPEVSKNTGKIVTFQRLTNQRLIPDLFNVRDSEKLPYPFCAIEILDLPGPFLGMRFASLFGGGFFLLGVFTGRSLIVRRAGSRRRGRLIVAVLDEQDAGWNARRRARRGECRGGHSENESRSDSDLENFHRLIAAKCERLKGQYQ